MKMKWSVMLSLILSLLAGCGKEEFGSAPKTNTSKADAVTHFETDKNTCPKPSEIKPEVDILFMVDNSESTYFVPDEIKSGIRNMVGLVSQDFDYRFIATPLLAIDSTPFNDYQILTNSEDPLSPEAQGKKIISASELNFFQTKPMSGVMEAGLKRTIDFIKANKSSLFRENANLLVVIFSNGRDTDVEKSSQYDNNETTFSSVDYNNRLNEFNEIKTSLKLNQLRLLSMTAATSCRSGWFSSKNSYIKMSADLYDLAGAQDSVTKDSYDLCNGTGNIFASVNSSIEKVKINHTYRYWPISFAANSQVRNDFGDIKAYKVSGDSSELMPPTEWTYHEHTGAGPLNIREPIPGEPDLPGGQSGAKHFIRLNTPVVSPPTCILIKSSTRTEYFGYVVLNQEPKPDTINLRINGKTIPKSSTDGWTYVGSLLNQNIKMPHPKEGDQLPASVKSGFMLKLNGTGNYYRSGDSVEVNFIAAPL